LGINGLERWTCLKFCFNFVGLCHIYKWSMALSTKIFCQQKPLTLSCVYVCSFGQQPQNGLQWPTPTKHI
jgi:hypothetical protein